VWTAKVKNGRLWLSGNNRGRARLRVASLAVTDGAGHTVSYGDGLVGYVLAGSTVSWGPQALPADFGKGGKLTISLRGNNGPVQATAMARGAD
jgi:fimbrial chaperone protein